MAAPLSDKPFKCTICEKAYRYQESLWMHLWDVHNIVEFTKKAKTKCVRLQTDKRPYKCTICDKAYRCQGDLRRHTTVHTGEHPYVCSLCGKIFSYKNNLSSHMCERSFKLKDHVREHIMVHSGPLPYLCPGCNKSFTYSDQLQRHMKTHNNQVELPLKLPRMLKQNISRSCQSLHLIEQRTIVKKVIHRLPFKSQQAAKAAFIKRSSTELPVMSVMKVASQSPPSRRYFDKDRSACHSIEGNQEATKLLSTVSLIDSPSSSPKKQSDKDRLQLHLICGE